MFRFANYVFGTDVEQNDNNENLDLNQCTEEDIEDDWILIDVPIDSYKKANQTETQAIAANYETTTTRVPQNDCSDTSDAQQLQQSIDRGSETSGLCPGIEESWFVTPPPCFNSLSNPIIIETPFENLLIEHPSMSVFGPTLPPIARTDHRSPHSESLPTDMSSNDSTLVSAQTMSRRQMRQLRRQQQNAVQHRNPTQTNVNLHLRTAAVLDELHVLNEMQSREVFERKKLLTKSVLDRQNKVLVQRNKPENRRSKMAVRPNGIYNNRNKC